MRLLVAPPLFLLLVLLLTLSSLPIIHPFNVLKSLAMGNDLPAAGDTPNPAAAAAGGLRRGQRGPLTRIMQAKTDAYASMGGSSHYCREGDLKCKIQAEDCRRTCHGVKAPLIAKCTAIAALSGPIVSSGLALQGYLNVGAVVGSTLSAISPYCEGFDPCRKCGLGRGLRDFLTQVEEKQTTAASDLALVDAAIFNMSVAVADLDAEVREQLLDVSMEIGLNNVYLHSWMCLAGLEAIHSHTNEQEGVLELFIKILSRPRVTSLVEELELAFFDMIAGPSAYIRLSPGRYCNVRALTSLQLAQTKVREIYTLSLITRADGDEELEVNFEEILEEFREHQREEKLAVDRACSVVAIEREIKVEVTVAAEDDLETGEEEASRKERLIVDEGHGGPPSAFVGTFDKLGALLETGKTLGNISLKADSEKCREVCETKVQQISVWCEAIAVFGASLVCATFIFSQGFGCTLGSAVGAKASVAGICASGIFDRSCEKCGESLSFDDVLRSVDSFHREVTVGLSNSTADAQFNISHLRRDFLISIRNLRKFYHITQAYGKFMHKVAYVDTLFRRLRRDQFGLPLKDRHYTRFYSEKTMISILECLGEFHVLLVGSDKYRPFHLSSIFQIDREYCEPEALCTLEQTQFGLIEKLFHITSRLDVDNVGIKGMIARWREAQFEHIEGMCRGARLSFEKPDSMKFILNT